VAALDLNDRGARPLGHGTLGVRWNHLVLGGDQVPARLGSPRGFADRAANGPRPHGTWESAINAAFSASTSAAKEAGNFALSETKNRLAGAVSEVRTRWAVVFNKRPYRLALVRSEGGDVYEG